MIRKLIKIFSNFFTKKSKIYLVLNISVFLILLILTFQNNILENFNRKIYDEVKDMTNRTHEDNYPIPECKKKHYDYVNIGTTYLKSEKQIEIINKIMKEDKNKRELYLLQIDAQNKNMENINKRLNNMLTEDAKEDVNKRCFDVDEFYK